MKTVKKRIHQLAEDRKQLCENIKKMIIEQLSLEIAPEFITNDQPLFGRGLELDSIDALDISVGLYDTFEVAVNDDNTAIYSSVNTMADYIQMVQEAQTRDPEMRKQIQEAWNSMGRERGEGPPDEYYDNLSEDFENAMFLGGDSFEDLMKAEEMENDFLENFTDFDEPTENFEESLSFNERTENFKESTSPEEPVDLDKPKSSD